VVLTLCFKVLSRHTYYIGAVQCVCFFLTQIRKNRCDSSKKRRPCVLSNILIVVISVGLPVAVKNPVLASYVGFQQIRATEIFCVKTATSAVFVGTPVMIYNFLLTVLSERHFRIFAN